MGPPPPDDFAVPPGLPDVGWTVTVVETRVLPPGPVHSSSKVLVEFRGPVVSELLVAFVPAQAPPAEQLSAPVDDQLRLLCPPALTVAGLAVSCTVGAATISTITDLVVEPPGPVHVIVNAVLDDNGPTDSAPCTCLAPVQGPASAVHEVAPVVVHSRVVYPFSATGFGFAEIAMLGGSVVPATATVTVRIVVAPLEPEQLSTKSMDTEIGPTVSLPVVPFAPVQPPLAEHDVASGEFQLS